VLKQTNEEKELSEALDKIREMEEKEKTKILSENSILEYLK
jgi:hypothetical protein